MEAVTSLTLMGVLSLASLFCWWLTMMESRLGMATWPLIWARPSTNKSDQLFLTRPTWVSYLQRKTQS